MKSPMNLNASADFLEWIRRMVGKSPRKIGNVTFAKDSDGLLFYDLPSNQWDPKAIADDIVNNYHP